MGREAVRPYRRAILIYLLAVVLPVCGLVWLGLRSFERQRQALETLEAEQVAIEIDARTAAAAAEALADQAHPLGRAFLTFENGVLVEPWLPEPTTAVPSFAPDAFAAAERQELELGRPDLALASYRRLLGRGEWEALALGRIARCLEKLGRTEEARATWHTLAHEHPDARDLSHRPFGIVAAIQAGETDGLFDAIAAGRWRLSADQLTYFLELLDAERAKPVLERYRLAQVQAAEFQPANPIRQGQIYRTRVGADDVFYRADGPDRIVALVADPAWIQGTLRPIVEREISPADRTSQELVVYGGATALVFVILSGGIFLLVRDLSREARANRLRSDFVSSVSHELKTPITLIHLYGETLLRHGHLPAIERDEFLRIITRESTRLGRLVDRVLTFSRVERGGERYAFEVDDPTPVVAGVVNDYREWLTQEGFSVNLSVPDVGPPVRFDRAALSQAVLNLLDNAAKYSGASRYIAVRLAERDPDVAIEVEDHGVGIAPADQPRIFDRFYRGRGATGAGGQGLGLFMVRHIVEAHGGRIEIESEPGRGSLFRLILPRAAA
jgi:signal transduction histidine kinase